MARTRDRDLGVLQLYIDEYTEIGEYGMEFILKEVSAPEYGIIVTVLKNKVWLSEDRISGIDFNTEETGCDVFRLCWR